MTPRSFYLDQQRGSGEPVDIQWLASLAPVFTSDQAVVLGTKGAQRIWASRKFVLSHSICKSAHLLGQPFLARGRSLDHVGFCAVLEGAVGFQAGSALSRAEAGDLLLLDLREPMRLDLGGQRGLTSTFTLWVPRARLPAQLDTRSARHGLVAKAIGPSVTVATAAVRALLTQLDAIAVDEMDELVTGLVEIIGRAIGLSAASKESGQNQRAPLDTFVTLCRYIEGNLAARDLGVAKLAATFGLSRASLYRLFEPVGGVASFIRERRLARAHHELSAPRLQDRRIGPIAYQAGFHSIATFNRAFLAAYGETPRNLRKQQIGSVRLARCLPDDIGVLARWLLDTTAS
jgi:AraC-like DNA-binding protein